MSILEFLTKLDSNLTNSLNAFDKMDKNVEENNLSILTELIKKNNINLYTYLEMLKKVESRYFTNVNTETKPFMLSFDIDKELYDKNFKTKFKEENQININKHKLQLLNENSEVFSNKHITTLDEKDISPNSLNIPVIKDLKNISPMFHWYDGDKFNKKGVYVCMSKGFYCRVPFPNMLSTTDTNFKINSIACKFETLEACNIHKIKISQVFNSEVRECFYVHKKQKFMKIGSYYRCNRESFGNHETLTEDMDFVNTNDIKRILMHSLSDSLLSVLWYQNKFKDGNLLLNNLEIY
jgi:hypothetical protein